MTTPLPWYVTSLIGLTCSAVVAFLIKAYLFMDSVKDNHLKHIQEGVEKIADNTASMSTLLVSHDRAEQEHYETVLDAFSKRK